MNEHSDLLSRSLGIIYPIIIVVGIYITLNGHITPGGGFQGGVVLSAVYISKYLVLPIKDINVNKIQKIEKISLVFILMIPLLLITMGLNAFFPAYNRVYLMVMNCLIGIKVACGLSVVFIRFVYYEVR